MAGVRSSYGDTSASTRPSGPEQAIAQLGDPRFAVREEATAYLLRYGLDAEPLLVRAAISPDPEVSLRAKQILKALSLGILPETPATVRDLLARYVRADVTGKEIALNQLSRQAGYGTLVILRLSQDEVDPAVRQKAEELAHQGLPEIQRTAGELLSRSHTGAARQLLSGAALAGDVNSARPWAALLLDQGPAALGKAIAQLEARKFDDPAAATRCRQLLYYLHRAAGDIDKKHTLGLDPNIRWWRAIESAQWQDIAEQLARNENLYSPVHHKVLLATVQRFLLHQTECDRALAELQNIEADAQTPLFLGLVLNDHADQAADMLIGQRELLKAFSLLDMTSRYGEAVALATRNDVPSEQMGELRVQAAILEARLGKKDAAVALCGALEKQLAQNAGFGELQQLCFLEQQLAEQDAAWQKKLSEHLSIALASARQFEQVAGLLSIAFPHEEARRAAMWWQLESVLPGPPEMAQRLRIVRELLRHKESVEELDQLGQRAIQGMSRSNMDAGRQVEMVQGLVDEFSAIKQPAKVHAYVKKELDDLAAQESWEAGGRAAVANQEWQQAEELLKPLRDPPNQWLRGWAMEHGGDSAGAETMRNAVRNVLGDDDQRLNLAAVMQIAGQEKLAGGQYAMLARIGEPGSWQFCVACQRLGDMEFGQGQWKAAIDHWRQYMLMQIIFETHFDDFQENVEFPRAIHEAQARMALEAGDDAAGVEQIRQMLNVSPSKSEAVIQLCKWLRGSKPAVARELFDVAAGQLKGLLMKYPNAGMLHNNLAWLCAECGFEPALALEHAKRAVELQPRDADSLDTLAEVYQQAGDLAKAMEFNQRCRDLEPGAELWEKRGKEFATTQP